MGEFLAVIGTRRLYHYPNCGRRAPCDPVASPESDEKGLAGIG
jgi:hypothetical protein